MDKSTAILSLYDITVAAVCDNYKYFKKEIRLLPETILFDIYMTLYHQARLCVLGLEFSDLDVFIRMLKMSNQRILLIKCFQALMRHGTGVAKELTETFMSRCKTEDIEDYSPKIDVGLKLGNFLLDAGWFAEAIRVLNRCKEMSITLPEDDQTWRLQMEILHKLLHCQVVFSQFDSAADTKDLAERTLEKLKNAGADICLSGIYTQFSMFEFHVSNYDKAYVYSVEAVSKLSETRSTPRVMVEALSQASKSCVVKREFGKAAALVRQAVYLAREVFGSRHPKYADALLDYGFYLLNSDSMKDSVVVYEKALKLKEGVFGTLNLHVAVTHEELAYALYVHEYSSGRFYMAKKHAEEAITIMMQILPKEHLLLASAQRVKALILEEIALDHMSEFSNDRVAESKLLEEAEKLHIDALRLARLCFGEDNVQTAKHYGNLGRLYQSMRRYDEAEAMHLKAIEIKERLLGDEDYEVGLSVGHLASLYNYHIKDYRKAEVLYQRSIKISLKLFSETYSGLEYDYRGLTHVYEALGEIDNVALYLFTIARWKQLREETENKRIPPLSYNGPMTTIGELQNMFCGGYNPKRLPGLPESWQP